MNTITIPIGFTNASDMNTWYAKFDDKAIEICKKYGVMELWDNAKIIKDENTFQVAIVSLGVSVRGSNSQKAENEILKTFESMF